MGNRNSLLIVGTIVLFLFAGCAKEVKESNKQVQSTNQTQVQEKTNDLSFNGVITKIGENEITIAKNPMGMPGGQGNGAVAGENDNSNAKEPDKNPTSDANPQQSAQTGGSKTPPSKPNGQDQSGQGDSNTLTPQNNDITKWDKVVCKIDDNTKISKIQMSEDNKAEKVDAAISDISVGTNIMVTLRSDDKNYADTIQIIGNRK
ncbi:MAG: hypothetical protein N2Z65_08070 [Clostridiales bacterium]|nr:hypothetical protein [Clostridiales bacterium]